MSSDHEISSSLPSSQRLTIALNELRAEHADKVANLDSAICLEHSQLTLLEFEVEQRKARQQEQEENLRRMQDAMQETEADMLQRIMLEEDLEREALAAQGCIPTFTMDLIRKLADDLDLQQSTISPHDQHTAPKLSKRTASLRQQSTTNPSLQNTADPRPHPIAPQPSVDKTTPDIIADMVGRAVEERLQVFEDQIFEKVKECWAMSRSNQTK